MYYDQLLALKRDLHILLVQTINDYMITDCEKEERITNILGDISVVEQKMKNYLKFQVLGCGDKEKVREYKKQVKYTFLTQAQRGYSLNEIMRFIKNNIKNPGINLEKYITQLRHPYGYLDEGYFTYEDSFKENSRLVLSLKAKRYLENEANVGLKK